MRRAWRGALRTSRSRRALFWPRDGTYFGWESCPSTSTTFKKCPLGLPAALPELPRHDPVPRRKRAVRGTALRSVEMDDRTSSVNGPRRGIVVLELISLEPGGCCCHSPTRARR